LGPIDQLSVLVVGKVSVGSSGSTCFGDLFSESESWDELDDAGEHKYQLNIIIYYLNLINSIALLLNYFVLFGIAKQLK
jgi:hypothetical protein